MDTAKWKKFISGPYQPPNGSNITDRVTSNLSVYLINYLVVVGVCIALSGYFSKGLLYLTIVVFVTALLIFLALKDVIPREIGGQRITQVHKFIVLAVEALLIVWWAECFYPLLYASILGALIGIAHASFKKRSTKTAMTDNIRGTTDRVKAKFDK